MPSTTRRSLCVFLALVAGTLLSSHNNTMIVVGGRRTTTAFLSARSMGADAFVSHIMTPPLGQRSTTTTRRTTTTTTTTRHLVVVAKSNHVTRRPLVHKSRRRGHDDDDDNITTPQPIPRPGISVCVRCRVMMIPPRTNHDVSETTTTTTSRINDTTTISTDFYLLVQRGQEPNQGQWSLPGGKLEWGETALAGAVRELREETVWPEGDWARLQWHHDTVCTTDAIGPGYHYLLAHCFAEMILSSGPPEQQQQQQQSQVDDSSLRKVLPKLQAADDAAAVEWWQWPEIQDLVAQQQATPGIDRVIQRIQQLSQHNLLPTTKLL